MDAFVGCDLRSHFPALLCNIQQWQSLIGGSFALLAAWWTVHTMRAQMRQTEAFRQQEITRKHNATRIISPFVLSEISHHLDSITDRLCLSIEIASQENSIKTVIDEEMFKLSSLEWSNEIQLKLSRLAETMPKVDDTRHISELTSSIHVINERIKDLIREPKFNENFTIETLLICAKSKYLNENLISYTMLHENELKSPLNDINHKIIWEHIRSASKAMVMRRKHSDLIIAKLNNVIDRRITNGTSPWLKKLI